MKIHRKKLIGAAALLLAFTAAFFANTSTAQACDACNEAFLQSLEEGDRKDTILGQHYEQTAENHSKFSVLEFGNTSDDESSNNTEEPAETIHLAQAGNPSPANPGPAASPTPSRPAPSPAVTQVGQLATGTVPNPHNRNFAEIYEDDEFIEIIERDYGLPDTPPTSYVPQDVEPDVEVTIQLHEGKAYLGQGIIYDGFLTSGGIPGPNIRVQQGDIVKFNIENAGTIPHGGSIHAAYTQTSKYIGQIPPGETQSVTFRATYPGVFMYHCAPGGHAIPMHVMGGQYGMIVVEPEQNYRLEEELGQEPDLALYVVQNEVYATGQDAIESNPAYTAFNGQPFRYVEDPIAVEPGDYVRIYYLNVGPNLTSTFHFVGLIWDYVYWQGHPEAWMPGGQTVTAGPSDSWVIELRIPPDEGAFTMLTHVVAHATRGAIGLMVAEDDVEGPDEILAEGPTYSDEEMDAFVDEAVRTIAPFKPGSRALEHPEVYGDDVDEVVVMIKGNSYNPSVIEIAEGTEVTWINDEVFGYLDGEFSGIHNAVGTSGPEQFATTMLAHNEQDSFTFTAPGEYEYMCTPHPYMQGRVIVRGDDDDDDDEAEADGCSSIASSSGPTGALIVLLFLAMATAVIRRVPGARIA